MILDPHETDPMSLVLLVAPLVHVVIASKLCIPVDFSMKVVALDLTELSPCLLASAMTAEFFQIPFVD